MNTLKYSVLGITIVVLLATFVGATSQATVATTASATHACNSSVVVSKGNSVTCGNWKVKLTGITVNYSLDEALVNVYYSGVLVNRTYIFSQSLQAFAVGFNTTIVAAGSMNLTSGTAALEIEPVPKVITACNDTKLIYLGEAIKCGGYKVQLVGFAPYNCVTIPVTAGFDVYYTNILTNTTQLKPKTSTEINVTDHHLFIYLNNSQNDSTQHWAQFSLTENDLGGTCSTGLNTLGVGESLECGLYNVTLVGLGPDTSCSQQLTYSHLNVYYNGVLTNTTSVLAYNNTEINDSIHGAKNPLHINVGSVFDGLYVYQRWAQIKLIK